MRGGSDRFVQVTPDHSMGPPGWIDDFATLIPERQEWFRARNLVAPYLRRKDNVARDRAA